MDQLINILLAIDKAHTVPQMALDCGPGLGGVSSTDMLTIWCREGAKNCSSLFQHPV